MLHADIHLLLLPVCVIIGKVTRSVGTLDDDVLIYLSQEMMVAWKI